MHLTRNLPIETVSQVAYDLHTWRSWTGGAVAFEPASEVEGAGIGYPIGLPTTGR